ncbi:DEAD/DEAH box helicase, partial [uncultured Corynebacterium sp.]|uniref:DEAD/DEAH box helicase n=1 Tax=uncultured Corynebacterium sp. TaxID=159447 RepID=UPI0025FA060E
MTEHRVHLLWLAGRGLHLWVERTDGHAVVVDGAAVGDSDLDSPLVELVRSRALRRRDGMRVATPKGQVREISLYTQAWAPEQALVVLGTLSAYLRGGGDREQLSAETVWFVRLYELLLEIVDTGRVMMKLHFADGQWFPVWCVSSSGAHNRTLREFQAYCPVVLTLNGGEDVLLRAADELVHWMCVARLQDRSAAAGAVFDNHFVSALVSGDADRRLTPVVADGLAAWRRSATEDSTKLVLVLQEPQGAAADDSDDDEETADAEPVDPAARRWRLGVRLSVDDAPAGEISASEAGDREKRVLRLGLDAAYRAWPPLRDTATAVEGWLRTGVWFPESASLTGRPAEDRALSLALTMADVEDLLSGGVAALTTAGIDVLVPRGWSTVRPTVKVRISPVGTGPAEGRMGTEQVLSFDWDISVDGERLTPLQKHDLLTSARSVVQVKGRYVRLDGDSLSRARSYFRTVTQAQQAATEEDATSAGNADDPHPLVTLGDLLSAELASRDRTWNTDEDLEIDAEGWVGRMLAAQHPCEGDGEMPALAPPERVEVPAALTVTLRDHQQRGLNWLVWMFRHRLGAILADDMGLGKTLQVLALLAWEREHGEVTGPTLVVAPTSVLEAWNSEVARHAPTLRVLVDHGSGKVPEDRFPAAARAVDLVLTTYGTVGRNPARYAALRWGRVVADEAQNIKNPGTAQSRAVRGIPADHRLALSGTPVENRLSELHTLMDFCNPGLLGSAKAFHN